MRKDKLLILSILGIFLIPLSFTPVVAGSSTFQLESMDFLDPGAHRVEFGAGYEAGRVLWSDNSNNRREYDRYQVSPLQLRLGLLDNLEFGVKTDYVVNASDRGSYPDENTVNGVNLFSRVKWHRHIGTTFRFKFAGDPGIQPYGSDRVQFNVNFPMVMNFAGGKLHSEVGYTFASGDVEDESGNEIAQWADRFNFGVGYGWRANNSLSYIVEAAGHGATAEFDSSSTKEFEDHLQLNLVPVIHFTPRTQLKPSVGLGLLEGSPDFAFNVNFSMRFGDQKETAPGEPVVPESRYSTKEPVGGVKPRKLPQPKDKKTDVKKLKDKARQAYNRGKLDAAIKKYKKVIPHEPDNADLFANLGSLYYRKENYLKARDFYRRAIQIDSSDAVAHQYLGATYYQLGEWDRARKQFRRVLELQPENQEVKRWLSRLE